jgi:alpha-L-rhamnosidase
MAQPGGANVTDLTVERRAEPIGIDVVQPRFAWRVSADGRGSYQSGYHLQLIDTNDPGANWDAPIWDTGMRDSEQSTYAQYVGPRLASRGPYAWRVRVRNKDGETTDWSNPSHFEMGLLEPEDWSARWITHLIPDLVSAPEERLLYRNSPALRRKFTLPTAPERARLYITAQGIYEAFINGARVGEQWLAPGWTDYHLRIQYQTYDVTPLLGDGENVLAVRLGDGWFAGRVGAMGTHRYGDSPALLCQLEARFTSGEPLVVGSDDRWVAHETGTWLHDLQLGERTDLRQDPSGWTDVGFDDSGWQSATLRADPGSRLVSARDDGVQVVETFPAASVRAVGSGRHIADLAANGAGVIRIRTTGTPGQHIVIRHAEALDEQGELYVENLRGAEQQDEFILAQSGPVVLEPRLTFHGFRYAEISGIEGDLDVSQVDSRVLSSATRLVGAFSCSDPRVEQLQRNIITSLRANFISIPTDCPQRNERLGWTADLQIFAPTALFNADLTNMLDKWLDDLADEQMPSGAYTDIAPAPSGWSGAGNTAWSDAGIIVPWVLYERSGDAGVLDRLYGSMRRYMRFLEADHTHGYRFAGRYGDWVSLGAGTDKTLIGTAYLAYTGDLFSRIASAVGNSADSEHYRAFAEQIGDAFRRRYVRPDGSLAVETQTAYAMALAFGLMPPDLRIAAGEHLAELVRSAGTHLATGFLGTPLVMPALSDNGQHELACQLLQQDTYPSWLFEVQNGATSIWERWNGWTPEQGFYSPQMNSFNHYAFGAVGDWMYRYLAGLNPVEPGYRRADLRPRPGAAFTAARASHQSLYGEHACGWSVANGSLQVEVAVPGNTSASVVLPVGTPDGLRVNGQAADAVGLAPIITGNELRIDVAPGTYHFEAPYRAGTTPWRRS